MEKVILNSVSELEIEALRDLLYSTFNLSDIQINKGQFSDELKDLINQQGFNIKSSLTRDH